MLRIVDHLALAVAGYVEPWTGSAGQRRLVSLSSVSPIDTVRIRALDRDGMPEIHWPVELLAESEHRTFSQGSRLAIDLSELDLIADIEFELFLTQNLGRRVLIDAGSFALFVDNGDRLILRDANAETSLGTLPTGQWLAVSLSTDNGLSIVSLDGFRPFTLSVDLSLPQPDWLVFCSDEAEVLPTLNCRLANIATTGSTGKASWAFPTLFTREPLIATGLPIASTLKGNPTFCVKSSRWDGTSLDPRLTPDHYDAIHFHDTDMEGLDWPASFAIEVPAGARSGIYAVEIASGGEVERLPFFVSTDEPRSPLLFVAPTATYLAYADEYLPPHLYEWIGTDRGHQFARDNNLRSLYDYHSDVSGVSLTTTRRPKATLRDDYNYPLCGSPHLLPVDLHFLRFAARNAIPIDLVTDRELHDRGVDLLASYRGVVTGSHPEYLSIAMEGAYRKYIAQGGRLAYMGGNGFAATVAFKDDVMELRRGPTQAGRTWDGPLAEMALALTNEPGGYLRDRGRGEYSLIGVGIALMGFSKAQPFTRTQASRHEDFSWLFDGVQTETFGDTGIVLGGAAGYEVDNTNSRLGTPDNIVILATAGGFSDDYVDDPGKWYEQGGTERAARRVAEMTYLPHASGGGVFSASSVCWLGALPGLGEQNDVGRITTNLLMHFSR